MLRNSICLIILTQLTVGDWIPCQVKEGLLSIDVFVGGSEHPMTFNENLGFTWVVSSSAVCPDSSNACSAEIQLDDTLTLWTDIMVVGQSHTIRSGELGLSKLPEIHTITLQPDRVGFNHDIDTLSCEDDQITYNKRSKRTVYIEFGNYSNFFDEQTVQFSLSANDVLIPRDVMNYLTIHGLSDSSPRILPSINIRSDDMSGIQIEPKMFPDNVSIRINDLESNNIWAIPVAMLKDYQMEITRDKIAICKYMQPILPEIIETKYNKLYRLLFSKRTQSPTK